MPRLAARAGSALHSTAEIGPFAHFELSQEFYAERSEPFP